MLTQAGGDNAARAQSGAHHRKEREDHQAASGAVRSQDGRHTGRT